MQEKNTQCLEDSTCPKDEKKLPYIVAADFDGTLFSNKYPEIGEPNIGLIEQLRDWRKNNENGRLILWTCRDNETEERLRDAAVEACRQHGLEFDAVNQNVKEVIDMWNNDTRKVFAHEYIDDRAVQFYVPSHWMQNNG